MYIGLTTAASRDNDFCSRYIPITWQIDCKFYMVSTSRFDQVSKDILNMADDMSGYPYGSRILVAYLTADNQKARQ